MKTYLGLDINKINKKEKVICTLNNWNEFLDNNNEYNLVNGTVGFIEDVQYGDDSDYIIFKPDYLDTLSELFVDNGCFLEQRTYRYNPLAKAVRIGKEAFIIPNFKDIKKTDENYKELISKFIKLTKSAEEEIVVNRFEPAYAISCHKSQGSEWNNVVVFDDSYVFGEERFRWLYTAVTRAKNKLVIVRK